MEHKSRRERKRRKAERQRRISVRSGATELNINGYTALLRPANNASRDLVVMMAPGPSFALFKYNFDASVLFLADSKAQYYITNIMNLVEAVCYLIDRENYQRVIFVGSSKAGFGALSIGHLCARRRPERTFYAIGFSPQIRLYPRNERLHFESYAQLCRRASRNKRMGLLLRRHGDLSLVGAQKNLVSEIVFAGDALVDRAEAFRVTGANVRRRPIAGAGHGSIFHFVCHGLDRHEIAKRINRAYQRADDKDLLQTRPADVDAMVAEIVSSALDGPTLNELIAEVMARTPVVTPIWARGLGEARRALTSFVGSVKKTLRPAPAKS